MTIKRTGKAIPNSDWDDVDSYKQPNYGTHPETGNPLDDSNAVIVAMKVSRTEHFPVPVMTGEKGMTIGTLIDGHITDILAEDGRARIEHIELEISPAVWDTLKG